MKKSPASQLRIIGGQWRSRKLCFSPEPGLRPTTDRIRETLFNWLGPFLYGSRCLDLFAGSGALGLEALSRGAGNCVFIDRSSSVCRQIKTNLELLECRQGQVVEADALSWIKQQSNAPKPFDLVFVDPPFHRDLAEPACNALESAGLITSGSIIYIETETEAQPDLPPYWTKHRQKQTGSLCYSLYRFEH